MLLLLATVEVGLRLCKAMSCDKYFLFIYHKTDSSSNFLVELSIIFMFYKKILKEERKFCTQVNESI